jgi:putative transposase
LALIERQAPELSLSVQAKLLSLSRSSLYYQPAPPSAEEIAVKHRIDEIYTAWPFYGSRKISAQLRREGVVLNRKTVQRHMREMGIAGITPGPNLSRRAQAHRVFPYLLRNLVIERPNQVWGIDITYIRLLGGWLYLVAIIDWFSRYVLSWELDESLEMPFVMACVERALNQQIPEIWNSDSPRTLTTGCGIA